MCLEYFFVTTFVSMNLTCALC